MTAENENSPQNLPEVDAMWWFVARNAKERKKAEGEPDTHSGPDSIRRLREQHLLDVVPDITAQVDNAPVAIKIWLPEIVANTVKSLADYDGVSQSAWLRERLIGYLYGRIALRAYRLRKEMRVTEDAPRFSYKAVDRTQGRWVYLVPQLGKHTVAFKLWAGQQMRDDLQTLAEHAEASLSPFVREAIIGELLGRASLPERPGMFAAAGPEAMAWERGEDVPLREVPQADHDGVGHAEREWRAALGQQADPNRH